MTPRALGYRFPAEFAPHEATWLSWPHKEASWPGKIASIYPSYTAFIRELAMVEKVRINVLDEAMRSGAPGAGSILRSTWMMSSPPGSRSTMAIRCSSRGSSWKAGRSISTAKGR